MDNLVKLYIDYRIKKNLPELSKDEIFAIDDFDTWQGKHAAQHCVQRTGLQAIAHEHNFENGLHCSVCGVAQF